MKLTIITVSFSNKMLKNLPTQMCKADWYL